MDHALSILFCARPVIPGTCLLASSEQNIANTGQFRWTGLDFLIKFFRSAAVARISACDQHRRSSGWPQITDQEFRICMTSLRLKRRNRNTQSNVGNARSIFPETTRILLSFGRIITSPRYTTSDVVQRQRLRPVKEQREASQESSKTNAGVESYRARSATLPTFTSLHSHGAEGAIWTGRSERTLSAERKESWELYCNQHHERASSLFEEETRYRRRRGIPHTHAHIHVAGTFNGRLYYTQTGDRRQCRKCALEALLGSRSLQTRAIL